MLLESPYCCAEEEEGTHYYQADGGSEQQQFNLGDIEHVALLVDSSVPLIRAAAETPPVDPPVLEAFAVAQWRRCQRVPNSRRPGLFDRVQIQPDVLPLVFASGHLNSP
jgi:hypothetical protein